MIEIDPNFSFKIILIYIIPLLICIISFVGSILSLLVFYKYENLRLNGGKLTNFSILVEISLTITLFAAIFYDESTINQNTFNFKACTFAGFLMNFEFSSLLMLNLSTSLNFLVLIYRKTNQFPTSRFSKMVILAFISSLIFSIIGLISKDGYGMSKVGFCWFGGNFANNLIFAVLYSIIFTCVIVANIIIFVHQRKCKQMKKELFVYYNSDSIVTYLSIWIPVYLFFFVDFILINLKVDLKIKYIWTYIRLVIYYLTCFSGFLTFAFRLRDENLKRLIKKILKNLRKRKNILKKKNLSLNENLIKNSSLIQFKSEMLLLNSFQEGKIEEKDILNDDFSLNKEIPNNEFIELKEKFSNKQNLIKFLLGLRFLIEFNEKNPIEISKIPKKIPPWEKRFYKEFNLKKIKVRELLNFIHSQANKYSEYLSILNKNEEINCFEYAEDFFEKIKEIYDINSLNLGNSLNIMNNIQLITELEFDPINKEEGSFFLTEDNKLICKLINKLIKLFLFEHFLANFHDFLHKSKYSSFLNPIIGLYSFNFENINQNITIILSENLSYKVKNINCEFILQGPYIIKRKYNKKGNLKSETAFFTKDFEQDREYELKLKDKNSLIKILDRDIDFLVNQEIVNFKIHLIFGNINSFSMNSKDTSINLNLEKMESSDKSEFNDYNKFISYNERYECRCFVSDFECNIKNAKKSTKKSSDPLRSHENSYKDFIFSVESPEIYANLLIDTFQKKF